MTPSTTLSTWIIGIKRRMEIIVIRQMPFEEHGHTKHLDNLRAKKISTHSAEIAHPTFMFL